MITPDQSIAKWQQDLQQAYRSPRELLAALSLDEGQIALPPASGGGFELRVPRSFVERMRPGDARDPLLLQVLPQAREQETHPDYGSDPVGEQALLNGSGLIRKYRGRALVVTTAACAVHCRYCFRREFPYADEQLGSDRWDAAVEAIAADPTIDEVILSGGDPLSLSDRRLARLFDDLAAIDSVRRVRLHTRQPVVLPSRIDGGLLATLRTVRQPLVLVIHANHPNELNPEVRAGLTALQGCGALLLNQSVLLRDVNDNADTLVALSQRLLASGVMPYYLHLLDRVNGASHFEVSEERARAVAREMHAQLPGYLMPRLVREEAGMPGKTWLAFT